MNSFLLLGLFVAVVTGTFARVREEQGSGFLSQAETVRSRTTQNKWVKAVRTCVSTIPKKP